MNPQQNQYQRLRAAWKETYPEKSKMLCESEVVSWWNENKKDPAKISAKLNELRLKSRARGSRIITAFSKSIPNASSEDNHNRNISLEPVPESQCQTIPDLSETVDEIEEISLMPPPRKKPAQESTTSQLQVLNNRLLLLANAKNSGLELSKQQADEFRQLKKTKPVLEKKIKRLEQTQKASFKHRQRKKAVIESVLTTNPELADRFRSVSSTTVGHPSLNRDQPGLLSTILNLVSLHSSADERRRCESLRTVKSLDQLVSELRNAGFNISRSGVYLRLLPRDCNTNEGKRHVSTVPVKLIRAQNTLRKEHPDTHFAAAAVKYLKDLAVLLGEKNVSVVSQDDKARVPLGLPAAHKQGPILMRMDYRVQLPDHDWVVATKHKLIPSVYAGLMIKNNAVTYSGPTYIAIRSGKHDSSTARSHAIDLRRLFALEIFKNVVNSADGSPKPILILSVDGGPDENPRYPKTLHYAAINFKKYNLDALFVVTHAPHQSASNPVERRMAPLSRDLCGLILPHENFGNHLDSRGNTADLELEKKNFKHAGELLADVWSQRVIDNFEVVAEYVTKSTDTPSVLNNQSADTGADTSGTDSPGVTGLEDLEFTVAPSFLTEEWKFNHVRQSQYLLQIVKCGNGLCCGPAKTNVRNILQNQFLPSPVMYKTTSSGVVKTTNTDMDGHFMNLTSRLAFGFLDVDKDLPFDAFCPSVQEKLQERTCKYCKCYHASKVATKSHEKFHLNECQRHQLVEDEDDENILVQQNVDNIVDDGIYMISDLGQWFEPVFQPDVVGVSTIESEPPTI